MEFVFLRPKIEVAVKTANELAGMMACRFFRKSQPRLSYRQHTALIRLQVRIMTKQKVFLKAAAQRRFVIRCVVSADALLQVWGASGAGPDVPAHCPAGPIR
ncbi:MAG: hypothetical protein FWG10_10340 [Eubacteriaceae bacterium]|nr:hypothetical protein [Eubacteriaceae bacterium]